MPGDSEGERTCEGGEPGARVSSRSWMILGAARITANTPQRGARPADRRRWQRRADEIDTATPMIAPTRP